MSVQKGFATGDERAATSGAPPKEAVGSCQRNRRENWLPSPVTMATQGLSRSVPEVSTSGGFSSLARFSLSQVPRAEVKQNK